MTTAGCRRLADASLGPAVVFAAMVLSVPPPASASEAADQRVVLREFRGPQAVRFKDAIEGALLTQYSLVPDSMVTEASRRSGTRLRNDRDYAAVAKALNVQAFVSATVHKDQDWRIEMVVRKGQTGQAIARYEWSGPRVDALAATVARRTPRRLHVLLAANVDAPEASADATVHSRLEDAPAEVSDHVASRPADRDRPFLEVGVGSRIFSRSMSFAQNASGLPGYRLAQASGITAELALFPFAASEATAGTWPARIGVYGNVNVSFGIDTQVDASGVPARTDAYGYEVGARYRITAGVIDVLPRASYLVDHFSIANNLSPNVHYQVLRAGVGGRAAVWSRLSVTASLDYLDVLSAGTLTTTTFPHASANGLDLMVGAGYDINRTFELQMSAAFRRYGFDMHSRPGDTFIAGGASDQYLSMALAIAYRPSLERH